MYLVPFRFGLFVGTNLLDVEQVNLLVCQSGAVNGLMPTG